MEQVDGTAVKSDGVNDSAQTATIIWLEFRVR
jgi:hypothetical protein